MPQEQEGPPKPVVEAVKEGLVEGTQASVKWTLGGALVGMVVVGDLDGLVTFASRNEDGTIAAETPVIKPPTAHPGMLSSLPEVEPFLEQQNRTM